MPGELQVQIDDLSDYSINDVKEPFDCGRLASVHRFFK
jgi:hypothetical protein